MREEAALNSSKSTLEACKRTAYKVLRLVTQDKRRYFVTARADVVFTFARCGVPMPGHLALQCRRSPDRPRPHEGLERRLASPRLVVDRRPSRRAARALAVRAPAAIASAAAAERGGVEEEGKRPPARGRGARERADGLGVLVQLTRCAPAARDGSRHARVVVLGERSSRASTEARRTRGRRERVSEVVGPSRGVEEDRVAARRPLGPTFC